MDLYMCMVLVFYERSGVVNILEILSPECIVENMWCQCMVLLMFRYCRNVETVRLMMGSIEP